MNSQRPFQQVPCFLSSCARSPWSWGATTCGKATEEEVNSRVAIKRDAEEEYTQFIKHLIGYDLGGGNSNIFIFTPICWGRFPV